MVVLDVTRVKLVDRDAVEFLLTATEFRLSREIRKDSARGRGDSRALTSPPHVDCAANESRCRRQSASSPLDEWSALGLDVVSKFSPSRSASVIAEMRTTGRYFMQL